MVRPTEKEIWSFLDDRASMEVSKKVVKWLSSKEGRLWLSANSSGIFSHMEETGLPCDSDIPSDIMLDRIHSEIDRRSRRRRWSMAVLKVAVAIIPLIALGLIWAELDSRLGGSVFSAPEIVSEAAQPGERKVLIFQDGTKVYLNAGAVITYPRSWRLDRRRVSLEGEAYFEVEKDTLKPFVVQAGALSVEVLGTRFDVWAYPESQEIKTTLEQGSVQVRLNEASDRIYQLKPNEQLVYHVNNKEVDVRQVRSADYSDWRSGGLFFDNASFRDVIRTIERNYGVTVHLHTSVYNDNRLTIHFKKDESLENIFMLLKELIPGLEYQIAPKDVYLD